MHTARLLAVALILPLTLAAVAETLDDVEKQIVAKTQDLKSIQYDTQTVTTMESPQMTMRSKSQGKMSGLRDGDVWLTRMESKDQMKMKMGEMTQERESETLMVCDGKHVYTCSETGGQTTAMKMAMQPEMTQVATERMFDQMRRDNTLKLLPSETVDGRKAWVVEATPKRPQPNAPQRIVYYFDQEIGSVVRMVGYGAGDEEMMRMSVSNIKKNPALDRSQFKFEAPAGVQVMDMTQMQQGRAGGDQTQQAADEQTAEESEQPKQEDKQAEKQGAGGIKLPF